MARGFVYVVNTVDRTYAQRSPQNVPTEYEGRIYFGPCKKAMRPRMRPGDYMFGLSPSATRPRRFLFAAQIAERITFRDAYGRFPDLRGPAGPIHVRPVRRKGSFPRCCYEHIPGSIHQADWEADLKSRELDAFFVCRESIGWLGRWLGGEGPAIDEELLAFLRSCAVYGSRGLLRDSNCDATATAPVAYGNLYRGLHLETYRPDELIDLLRDRLPVTEVQP